MLYKIHSRLQVKRAVARCVCVEAVKQFAIVPIEGNLRR